MRKFRDINLVKEDLRAQVNIVEFISRFVNLEQRGPRWIGLCPFHEDVNNPGFAVSPEIVYEPSGSKGVWACWSCDARGDLFSFVQQINDLAFFEAIEYIAEAIKFDLSPYYRDLSPDEELKEQRYAVTEMIADLFCDQLLAAPTKLAFFKRRGIDEEIIREFKVGWCPSLDFLTANVERDVINMIEPKLGNRSRLFGDRFVYPQFTTLGRVWGWYARQPDDRAEGTPKYIGTSNEAPLFDGFERLYGFPSARKLLRKSKYPMLIVEGFHDALAAQQAGFPAVAACGTNLSAKQVETLQAHAVRKAIVAFDPDAAGADGMFKIAERAHEINSVQFQFVEVSAEPEEFIANYGADAFGDCLDNALGPIDFIVSRYASLDTSTATKKRDFLEHIRPYLVPYPRRSLSRALGVQAVSRVTNLSEEVISDFLDERSDSPLSNLTGELIVLAELAMNPQAWITLPGITQTDFSLRRYGHTYNLMRELYENEAEVNIDLLITHANNTNAPHEVLETIARLPSVTRKTPELFARDIRDKAVRRAAEDFASVMAHQVRDLTSPVVESIASMIEHVSGTMVATSRRPTYSSVEVVARAVQEMERRSNIESGIAGLDMGEDWKYITQVLNGHRGGRVNLVVATSGVGKSILGSNWMHCLTIAPEGPQAAGLIVSQEMSAEESVFRSVAIDSGVPHSLIDHARLNNEEQLDLIAGSLDRIRSARLTWMEGQRTLRDIALQARLLQSRGELEYILIDYIQLIDLSPYNDRWSMIDKYNQTSQDMHDLAETLNVPIIAMAQLNRKAMEEDIPTGEQMGSSIKIYQDAHFVLVLAPRDYGLVASVDKNRGSQSKGVIKLQFDTNAETSTLRIRESEVLKRSVSR